MANWLYIFYLATNPCALLIIWTGQVPIWPLSGYNQEIHTNSVSMYQTNSTVHTTDLKCTLAPLCAKRYFVLCSIFSNWKRRLKIPNISLALYNPITLTNMISMRRHYFLKAFLYFLLIME